MVAQTVWHILLDPSWLHEQAAAGLRCKRLLEFLKPSDPVGHLLRPRDVLAHRPSAKSGTPPSSPARHATAAHTSSSSTRLMLGSVAFTLAMSARATSSSAGVGAWRQLSLHSVEWPGHELRAIPRADSRYEQSGQPRQRASKRFIVFGSILKGLYVHFSLALLLLSA